MVITDLVVFQRPDRRAAFELIEGLASLNDRRGS
jgi:hypothetical protein